MLIVIAAGIINISLYYQETSHKTSFLEVAYLLIYGPSPVYSGEVSREVKVKVKVIRKR